MALGLLSIELNPKPFHEMSEGEAKSFLQAFLESQSKVFDDLRKQRAVEGRFLDFRRDCMVPYFLEYDPVVRPKFRDWGDRLSPELKALPEHNKGEAYFNEEAHICLLRMGYFFGECLRRNSQILNWSVGDAALAHAGMPVVAGFKGGMECPAINICKNTVRKITRNELSFEHFLTVFDFWADLI